MIQRYTDTLQDLGNKKPPRDYTETKLQIYVARYMRGEVYYGKNKINVQKPFSGLVFVYIGGEGREKEDRRWNYLKGRDNGIFDYAGFHIQIPHTAVETKITNGKLSPDQITYKENFEATGGKTCIARSVAEVRDFYIGLGLTCKNTQCIEPPASIAEKQAAYFAMLRRRPDDV